MKELTRKQQLAQLKIPYSVYQAYIDKIAAEVSAEMKEGKQ